MGTKMTGFWAMLMALLIAVSAAAEESYIIKVTTDSTGLGSVTVSGLPEGWTGGQMDQYYAQGKMQLVVWPSGQNGVALPGLPMMSNCFAYSQCAAESDWPVLVYPLPCCLGYESGFSVETPPGQGGDEYVFTFAKSGTWEIHCYFDPPAESLQGPAGPQGPVGPQGLPGIDGAVGLQGAQGKDGKDGATGSQGLKGEKGDVGQKGEKGDKGEKGQKGDSGDKGDMGSMGPAGPQGPATLIDGIGSNLIILPEFSAAGELNKAEVPAGYTFIGSTTLKIKIGNKAKKLTVNLYSK